MKQFRRLDIILNEEPGDDEAIAFAGCFARLMTAYAVLESAP